MCSIFLVMGQKGNAMAKCRQCNVTISEETTICPLCQCVVEAGEAVSRNEYPDVWVKERKLKHLCNFAFFGVLLVSAVLAIMNYAFFDGTCWSMIPISSMLYGYLVFRLVFASRKGYRWKLFIPMIFALILVLVIDIETGFYGWSMNYVFPSGILLIDLIIVILMLTNLKNWQSYIVIQIVMIAVSCIPLVLWAMGIITSPLLTIIALAVSVFLFLGAVILGDRTARGELKRRFHIR